MKKQYFYFYWSNILLYVSVLLLKYLICVLCPPLPTTEPAFFISLLSLFFSFSSNPPPQQVTAYKITDDFVWMEMCSGSVIWNYFSWRNRAKSCDTVIFRQCKSLNMNTFCLLKSLIVCICQQSPAVTVKLMTTYRLLYTCQITLGQHRPRLLYRVGYDQPSGSFSVVSNVNVPVICLQCVIRSSFRGRSREHWKGVVSFISPLLVNSSLAIVVNRNTAWLSERRCFASQTGWIYEKRIMHAFLRGYMQILDLPYSVTLYLRIT